MDQDIFTKCIDLPILTQNNRVDHRSRYRNAEILAGGNIAGGFKPPNDRSTTGVVTSGTVSSAQTEVDQLPFSCNQFHSGRFGSGGSLQVQEVQKKCFNDVCRYDGCLNLV